MQEQDLATLERRGDPLLKPAPLDPYSQQLLAWFFEIRDQVAPDHPLDFDRCRGLLDEYGIAPDDLLDVFRELRALDRAWMGERQREQKRRG